MGRRSAFIYNPDDEKDVGAFNGETFPLPAHGTLEILPYGKVPDDSRYQKDSPWDQHSPGAIAAHIEAQLHLWGIRVVSGEVRDGKAKTKEVQEEVDAANDAYLRRTREWAEELVIAFSQRAKPRRDAGLADPEMTPEEATAISWLEKNRKHFEKSKASTYTKH